MYGLESMAQPYWMFRNGSLPTTDHCLPGLAVGEQDDRMISFNTVLTDHRDGHDILLE